ncbi:hypothetical protein GQ457_09G015710 [Hibiscus cannabinus]
MEAPKKKKKKQRSENDTKAKLNARAMHILLCGLCEDVCKKKLYGKEEKKDSVPSCANLLNSSKVDGILALDEPKEDVHAIRHHLMPPSPPHNPDA